MQVEPPRHGRGWRGPPRGRAVPGDDVDRREPGTFAHRTVVPQIRTEGVAREIRLVRERLRATARERTAV